MAPADVVEAVGVAGMEKRLPVTGHTIQKPRAVLGGVFRQFPVGEFQTSYGAMIEEL